jgi:hypothetical protein
MQREYKKCICTLLKYVTVQSYNYTSFPPNSIIHSLFLDEQYRCTDCSCAIIVHIIVTVRIQSPQATTLNHTRKRCKASGDLTKDTVPPAVGDVTLDTVPQAGDKVGNSGWALKYNTVSLIVVNPIWNVPVVRTTKRCIARVPQAGKEVGNAGWVLTYDKVSQAMGDLIWNPAAQIIIECDITIATEDILLNPSVEWCLA